MSRPLARRAAADLPRPFFLGGHTAAESDVREHVMVEHCFKRRTRTSPWIFGLNYTSKISGRG